MSPAAASSSKPAAAPKRTSTGGASAVGSALKKTTATARTPSAASSSAAPPTKPVARKPVAGPSRPTASSTVVKKAPASVPVDTKPVIDHGEEEWAALMRKTYFRDDKGKGTGWYAKGVKTVEDKWQLLPAFLQVKGLVKQHLDSFNYFVNVDIKAILAANSLIVSDVSPNHYIRYTNIYISMPYRGEGPSGSKLTPMESRLTDSTYAGQILVDIEYTEEEKLKRARGLSIGSIPIMLRSDLCHLKGKNEAELAKMGECPLDPGGYFVVKGTEKVILVQEQLSKNRIIVMTDPKKDSVSAEVTS